MRDKISFRNNTIFDKTEEIMTVSLSDFITQITTNPTFLITTVLIFGLMMVNGWTDAPNAIATCVSTRSIKVKPAICMAAIANFLGLLIMCAVNTEVAKTIYNIVDFGSDPHRAMLGLCSAVIAIIVWALVAWLSGIPTSHSHALVAALTGSAIAVNGGFYGISATEWAKVIVGLFFSIIAGFILGWISIKFTEKICKNTDRRKTKSFFKVGQVACGGMNAFMHGAQDGQKFIGIFLMGAFFCEGYAKVPDFTIPIWLIVACSIFMAAGIAVGGYKIIKKVGMEVVKLETHQGFAVDLASSICLLIASLTGMPVSTTKTKTAAIMGVGSARRVSSVNWSVAKEMMLSWILVFPGCGIIAYITSMVFLTLF